MMKCKRPEIISITELHTFFKTDFKNDYIFKGERHDYWEIVFVTSGSVGVSADNTNYILKENQAIIHAPNEFHKIWSESEVSPSVMVISFSADFAVIPQSKILTPSMEELSEMQNLYDLSYKYFDRSNINIIAKSADTNMHVQLFWLKLELVIYSLVFKSFLKNTKVTSKTLKGIELHNAAIKYMEENPYGYSIDDIATNLSISGAYLKKLFKKYSGCGVSEYYNKLRARFACSYLTSGKNVKETANLLGFGDQNYFSTFFKKMMGTSPSEYKKGLKL